MKNSFLYIVICFFINSTVLAQNGVWTWMHGPQGSIGYNGNYGTQGVAAASNEPPARYQAAYWTDLNGNFWMFGGSNLGGTFGDMNDLWKFDITTNMWTWMKGPQGNSNQMGNYGVQGVSSPLNEPPARSWGANSWTAPNGDLYLFGGSSMTVYNDLWKYNIATNEWTWEKGDNTFVAIPSIFGTKGVPLATNEIGSKSECKSGWVFNNKLWNFGGSDANFGDPSNQLWSYDLATKIWTWESGSNTSPYPGNYGPLNVPSTSYLPSGRWSYTKWKNKNDEFLIFGGGGNFTFDEMNDFWSFNPTTKEWTWLGGSQTARPPGNYGPLCQADVNYVPLGRIENQTAQSVSNCASAFWTFGGINNWAGFCYNDLWIFDSDAKKWTLVSGSNTANPIDVYGTKGTAAVSNVIGGRGGTSVWSDANQNLWVFGGVASNFGAYADLWKFTPDTSCFNIIQANANFTWPKDKTMCKGDTLEYNFPPNTVVTTNPTSGVTYNPITGKIIFQPNSTTTYTINATTPPSVPCPVNGSNPLVITILEKPIADFDIVPKSTSIKNPTFSTNNTSQNATNYYWYYLGIFESSNTNISKTFSSEGDHCFTLVAENTCGLDTAIDCGNIYPDIFIPNAFSPNGDNENELFKLKTSSSLNLISFEIFNRFGEKVFKTTNPIEGWDGKYKDQKCEVGVYYYLVQFKAGEEKKQLKGDVTLLR